MNQIEEMFLEEIREKKRAGNGIHHRTGTRGYVGTMRTPVDFLNGKEKRAYKKNGKVDKYVAYDIILKYDQFLQLSEDERRDRLTEWRKRFKNSEISEGMGIETWRIYELVKKLGVVNKSGALPDRKVKGKNAKKNTTAKRPQSAAITSSIEETAASAEPTMTAPVIQMYQPTAPEVKDGFSLRLDGTYTGEIASEKILKLAGLLESDSTKYKVTLIIQEETE